LSRSAASAGTRSAGEAPCATDQPVALLCLGQVSVAAPTDVAQQKLCADPKQKLSSFSPSKFVIKALI
jgi:hypothetical protein